MRGTHHNSDWMANLFLRVCLSRGEVRKPPKHVLPRLVGFHEVPHSTHDFVLRASDLLSTVPLSERYGAIFDSIEIDSDAQRGSKLIVSGITFPYARSRFIYTVGDSELAKALRDVASDRHKSLLR